MGKNSYYTEYGWVFTTLSDDRVQSTHGGNTIIL